MGKLIYLVDDEAPLLSIMGIIFESMGAGHETVTFGDPLKALEAVRRRAPDLVISDHQMPELTGSELLEAVRGISPHTIRILMSGYVSSLARIGSAHQYLAKPCQAAYLKRTVAGAFSAQDRYLGKTELAKVVASLRSFPIVPTVYHKLIHLLSDPEYSVHDVSQLLLRDGGLLTKIIHLANSPLFKGQTRVTEPHEAILALGTNNLKTIVLSLHIFSNYDTLQFTEISALQLAPHSFLAAQRTEEISRQMGVPKDGEAFFAGMLHDLGQLILMENKKDGYQKACRTAIAEKQELIDVERQAFGISNTELAAFLLCLWGASPEVIDAVTFHPRPWENPHPQFNMTDALYVANLLARKKCPPDSLRSPPLNTRYLESLGVQSELIRQWSKDLAE